MFEAIDFLALKTSKKLRESLNKLGGLARPRRQQFCTIQTFSDDFEVMLSLMERL